MLCTIELKDLLWKYWKKDVSTYSDGVETVETLRHRENRFRRYLPDKIVRRMSLSFARSSTVHPETGQALYALCSALHPEYVFETGTYWGYSTCYLAAALRDNGRGIVHSFDIYPHAGKHLLKSLHPYVELHLGKPAAEAMPPILREMNPTLFFQDSRHDYEGVSEELHIVAPYLKNGSVILLHDFIVEGVRQAAIDELPGYEIYILSSGDPQQLGVAIKSNGTEN